jgi:hypothetical protein
MKQSRATSGLYIPEKTDLREITSDAKRCISIVTLEMGFDSRLLWLMLGEASLRSARDTPDGRWFLEAFLPEGVTDFEHDGALALRLPLIGLMFKGVRRHTLRATAWIDPNEDLESNGKWAEFHVPRPGYNPMKHKEAFLCKTGRCAEKPHTMVPPGFYVPPFDEELYLAVRGKKVEITLGLTHEDE